MIDERVELLLMEVFDINKYEKYKIKLYNIVE